MGEFSNEIKKQFTGYILTALGLVAGLAWNEAIKGFIDYLYPLVHDSLPAKFIYAVVITVFVVLLGWYLGRKEK